MYEVTKLTEDKTLLRDPVLITAFAIRRRGGRLANNALDHVIENWPVELVAQVDCEQFIDFTVRRPNVRRPSDVPVIDWPETKIYKASPVGATRDFLLLTGFEPNFLWRGYVEALTRYADALGVRTLVCLRSFTGSVPHTRPAPVLINASDVELELQFGVQSRRTRYEGPTDIGGVLAAQGQSLGWQTVDLTVLQPYYFPRMTNAGAIVTLVKVLDHAFGTETSMGNLAETARSQIKAVEQSIEGDKDTQAVVVELEERYDAGAERMDFLAGEDDLADEVSLPSGEEAIREIEKLLRESSPPET